MATPWEYSGSSRDCILRLKEWNELLKQKVERGTSSTCGSYIAQALGGKRLARQHPITKDKHRTSQTELLSGPERLG